MPRLSANASPSWAAYDSISFGAIARLIEQMADVAHRFRRNAELALEGVDFLAFHRAVAFGELGRQHDDAYGEQLIAAMQHRGEAGGIDAGLLAQLLAKVGHGAGIGRMTERRADNSAHWAAHGKSRHAADDLAPVAHAAMVTRRVKERRFDAEGRVDPADARRFAGWILAGAPPAGPGKSLRRPLALPPRQPNGPASPLGNAERAISSRPNTLEFRNSVGERHDTVGVLDVQVLDKFSVDQQDTLAGGDSLAVCQNDAA